ncbi:hypothetical protein [Maribacter sp. LLG6340-A2]|uniref:hypothetical protein n=1 Tax=Maribacter sp. LLG6340-A2 TaxID=3160834 RepID=UPI00386DDCB1
MKTYKYVACLGMALSILACETPTNTDLEVPSSIIEAGYTVFLEKDNQISAIVLTSNETGLTLKEASTDFEKISSSVQKFRDRQYLGYYFTNNCEANVQLYNADEDSTFRTAVFTDVNPCNLQVTALAYTDKALYISYIQQLDGKNNYFALRAIPRTTHSETSYIDIQLDKKPIDVISSKGRLFILTKDEYESNAYYLSVIDEDSKEQLTELDLGNDATKLLKNNSGHIVVAYPELHTTLDPISLDKTYTMYGKGTEPGFLTAKDIYMDATGQIYYQKTATSATVTEVPAVYNFEKNSTIVYLYENFLTKSELDVKYNIASTTAIGFDEANEFILIGYKKKNETQQGGILRLSTAPEFKVVDHIDLEGVPQSFFIKSYQ